MAAAWPVSAQPPAPALPVIQKVENAGLLFTDNSAGVSGTDAGYSLPIGRQTLWLFGDVFLLHPSDPARNYVGGVSNCALLVAKGRGAAALRRYRFLADAGTGLARQVIPNAEGEGVETRLWPLGGWHDAKRQRAYLYYGHVRATGGGPLDFRIVGHGLARADISRPEAIRFARLNHAEGKAPWWPGEGALFGSAVVAGVPEAAPYLYLVGVAERQGRKFGKMARVLKERIEQADAYEYFVGTAREPRWEREAARAADIEGLSDFPNELSVAYNAYLGGYLAVHSTGLEPRIRLALAPAPWGPYRPVGEIGAPHRAFEKAFCYAGKEHPELAEQGGRVLYITYVDSQRYWLQLLKVTLARQQGEAK